MNTNNTLSSLHIWRNKSSASSSHSASSTQSKVHNILVSKSTEERLDENWNDIVNARKMLESSRNGKGKSLSPVSQKNIEKTIETLLENRKKLQTKQKEEVKEEGVKHLPIPYPGPHEAMSISSEKPQSETEKPQSETEKPQSETEKPQSETEKPQSETEKPQSENQTFIIPQAKIFSANISNVENNLRDLAQKNASERLRTEYGQANFFKKSILFFTRNKKLKRYTEQEMRWFANQNIFDNNSIHIRENASHRFSHSNTILNNSIRNQNSFINNKINAISRNFIQWTITENEFQEQFIAIIEWESISSQINIEQQGTNILRILRAERNFYEFLDNIPATATIQDIQQLLAHYPQKSELNQSLYRSLDMDLFENFDEIVQILANPANRSQIQNQDLNITIDILQGGNAAGAIENQNREDRVYRIGKWLQRHPVLSSVATAFGISASTLAGGPIGNMFFGSTAISATSGSRKYSDYTDEHKWYEERLIRGEEPNAHIYQTIEQLESKLQTARGFSRWWTQRQLNSARKKLELYQQHHYTRQYNEQTDTSTKINTRRGTTHSAIREISYYNEHITNNINILNFWERERRRLTYLASDALARLDAKQQTGHNFFKYNNANVLESELATLYENIILSSEKLGISIDELRQSNDYQRIFPLLLQDFKQANTSFEDTRKKLAIKQWITSGTTYLITSTIFQALFKTGFFAEQKFNTTPSQIIPGIPEIPWTTTIDIDSQIAKDLENALGTQKYQDFIASIKSTTTPETLWDTLVTDVLENEIIGNDIKNQIMWFILNASDVQNGITKPELLIEAGNAGIFDDIANNSSNIDRVLNLLQKWGYGNIDKNWMINTLTGLNNGSINVSSLNSNEQAKVAEFLWTYVHRDGQSVGSPLWQVFMDTTQTAGTPGTPDTIIPWTTTEIPKTPWEKYGIIGLPIWKNTFLSRLIKQKWNKEMPSDELPPPLPNENIDQKSDELPPPLPNGDTNQETNNNPSQQKNKKTKKQKNKKTQRRTYWDLNL